MSNRETSLAMPKNELFYHDETTGKYKPLATTDGAIPVVIVGGSVGGDNMQFLTGTSAPINQGVDGDIYLNASNGDLYKKENDAWTIIMNLKGATGAKGETGATGAKGDNGLDGFVTEVQYNDIITRLTNLENNITP